MVKDTVGNKGRGIGLLTSKPLGDNTNQLTIRKLTER